MQLQFGPRHGNEKNFGRALVIRDDTGDVLGAFVLEMSTAKKKRPDGELSDAEERTGKIYATSPNSEGHPVKTEKVLWEGTLPAGAPPSRAFALAAELCDATGDSSKLPLPRWAR